MKNNNYICYVPYLRNSIAYDHDFWCTCVKWWYLHFFIFFFIQFSKFWFFELLVEKGKKQPKMTRSSVRHASYLRNHTSYDCHLWNTCVKDNISRCCFHFLKILIFWIVMGLKGQKMAQNDKKFRLLRLVSQEPYIIWLSFMIHMCKMIISLAVVLFFQILIFELFFIGPFQQFF